MALLLPPRRAAAVARRAAHALRRVIPRQIQWQALDARAVALPAGVALALTAVGQGSAAWAPACCDAAAAGALAPPLRRDAGMLDSTVPQGNTMAQLPGLALHLLRCAWRCIELAWLALPPLLWLPAHLAILYTTSSSHQTKPSSSLMVRLLCNALERAGPTAIKLGQWVSTRPDLFPPELCIHFSARCENYDF